MAWKQPGIAPPRMGQLLPAALSCIAVCASLAFLADADKCHRSHMVVRVATWLCIRRVALCIRDQLAISNFSFHYLECFSVGEQVLPSVLLLAALRFGANRSNLIHHTITSCGLQITPSCVHPCWRFATFSHTDITTFFVVSLCCAGLFIYIILKNSFSIHTTNLRALEH